MSALAISHGRLSAASLSSKLQYYFVEFFFAETDTEIEVTPRYLDMVNKKLRLMTLEEFNTLVFD